MKLKTLRLSHSPTIIIFNLKLKTLRLSHSPTMNRFSGNYYDISFPVVPKQTSFGFLFIHREITGNENENPINVAECFIRFTNRFSALFLLVLRPLGLLHHQPLHIFFLVFPFLSMRLPTVETRSDFSSSAWSGLDTSFHESYRWCWD